MQRAGGEHLWRNAGQQSVPSNRYWDGANGWRCRLSALTSIKAKIDTGARTSALHAYKITPFEEEGRRRVRFLVHPVQRHKRPEVECVADVVDERMVTSSSGHRERRFRDPHAP